MCVLIFVRLAWRVKAGWDGCKAGVAWFEMQERRLAGVVTLGVTGGGTGPGARGSWLCPQPVSPGSALAPLALTLARLTREHGDKQSVRPSDLRQETPLRTLRTLNNVQIENCQD